MEFTAFKRFVSFTDTVQNCLSFLKSPVFFCSAQGTHAALADYTSIHVRGTLDVNCLRRFIRCTRLQKRTFSPKEIDLRVEKVRYTTRVLV